VTSPRVGLAMVSFVCAALTTPLPATADTDGRSDETRRPTPLVLAPSGATGPLTLDEVLDSVDARFPLNAAAEADRAVRAGELLAASGAFDTRLRATGDLQPVGFYENYAGGASLVQPTRLFGLKLFGGYRIGSGDYPSYYGNLLTDDGGEFAAGFELPLLRDRAIDEPRTKLRQSRIELEKVTPEIELVRIDTARRAAHAFWVWLAAGRNLDVAERLLGAAVARQAQIEGRVARGAEPSIDLVDNERLMVDRRLQLRGAERAFRQASVELSLYLRDDDGNPIRIGPDRLPAGFPVEGPPDSTRWMEELAEALESHPLLRRFALERERLELEAELARNEGLPNVSLRVEGSQDIGTAQPGIDVVGKLSPAPRSEGEVRALVRLELPLLRREARGRLAAVEARLTQLARREQFARDRIEADVLVAVEALEAAFAQTEQARRNLELAERMRSAEERKLALGSSNLIDVNIREVQAATASRGLIDAQAAYFRARADYDAAVARPVRGAGSSDGRV
jgi:cobalt-zinc-cadmium efflux system outer membrane protein